MIKNYIFRRSHPFTMPFFLDSMFTYLDMGKSSIWTNPGKPTGPRFPAKPSPGGYSQSD
jgi:hypothetical protein